jgi:hypothetical protein
MTDVVSAVTEIEEEDAMLAVEVDGDQLLETRTEIVEVLLVKVAY